MYCHVLSVLLTGQKKEKKRKEKKKKKKKKKGLACMVGLLWLDKELFCSLQASAA